MFTKKLYDVKWVSDFGHAQYEHGAAVIARNAKHAAKVAKQFFVIGADSTLKVAERGDAYLHTSDLKEAK